jgi:hypothetical protein
VLSTAAGGRCIFSLSCGGDNISIAWSRDGRRIAVGNKVGQPHQQEAAVTAPPMHPLLTPLLMPPPLCCAGCFSLSSATA